MGICFSLCENMTVDDNLVIKSRHIPKKPKSINFIPNRPRTVRFNPKSEN